MRKIIAALLSLVVCVMLPMSALAAETGTDETSYDVCLSVDVGDTVSVELTAMTAVTDGVVTITYDTSAVSVQEGGYIAVSDAVDMYSVNTSEDGEVKISWISTEATTGALFTLTFSLVTEVSDETFHLSGDVRDADNNAMTLVDPSSKEQVDKTALQELYSASQKLTESAYTADSWAVLAAAQSAALTVLEDEWATQAQIDSALSDLADAIAALVLDSSSAVDKTALQSLYGSSLLLTEGDYTAETWAVLAAAQSAALTVLENEDATQEEVDAAWLTLTAAIAGLEKASEEEPVNKDALLVLYENSLKLTESTYTEDTWAALVQAQEAALAVLEDENATQAEVDAVLAALNAAIQALVVYQAPVISKEALQAAYDSSLALTESSYTADSWAAMVAAQSAALTVLENEDATQEEIDQAAQALLNAIKALVLNGTSGKPGDTTPILGITALALISAAAVAATCFVWKTKRASR